MNNQNEKIYADSLTLEEMREYFVSIGEKQFRADQLFYWIFAAAETDFDNMSNMSKVLRENLKDLLKFTAMETVATQKSEIDGSVKVLFKLEDGEYVEAVMLRDGERLTGCISSQVGCRMGCRYCSTATMGLKRNLTVGEIVRQVMELNKVCGEKLTNLVFMGMGEPLDNADNLVRALDIILHNKGLNFSHNKVTVSTCGLADKMMKLFEMEKAVNIAVSLNAYDDKTRDLLMPINKKFPVQKLIDSLKKLPLKKTKRITIEYILLKGINDSIKDAEGLVKLLSGLKVKINLIGYNTGVNGEFKSTDAETALNFQNYLINKHFSTFVRKSLGSDIDGACGQLCVNNSKVKS